MQKLSNGADNADANILQMTDKKLRMQLKKIEDNMSNPDKIDDDLGGILESQAHSLGLWDGYKYYDHGAEDEKESNDNISDIELKFLATIAGEAIGLHNPIEWQAIGHVIMNRVGKDDWENYTIDDVLNPNDFHAIGDIEYNSFVKYINQGRPKDHPDSIYYEQLIEAALPIIRGEADDITNGAVFFASGPSRWTGEEVKIDGVNHHMFFLYP